MPKAKKMNLTDYSRLAEMTATKMQVFNEAIQVYVRGARTGERGSAECQWWTERVPMVDGEGANGGRRECRG